MAGGVGDDYGKGMIPYRECRSSERRCGEAERSGPVEDLDGGDVGGSERASVDTGSRIGPSQCCGRHCVAPVHRRGEIFNSGWRCKMPLSEKGFDAGDKLLEQLYQLSRRYGDGQVGLLASPCNKMRTVSCPQTALFSQFLHLSLTAPGDTS